MPKKGILAPRREIAAVRRALMTLEKTLSDLSRSVSSAGTSAHGQVPAPKARLSLSPARRESLRLHGRYLGFIRQLKPKQRAEVKAVRENKGVEAAIKRARKLAER